MRVPQLAPCFAALCFAVSVPALPAHAQEPEIVFSCLYTGPNSLEPVGDREGHFIRHSAFTCLAGGEPLTGGVFTGATVFEVDQNVGTLLSGNGILRKQGALTVYNLTEGKLEAVVTDGKVVGYATSGKGVWVLATGIAAPLFGKPFSFTSKSTGPGQFEIDLR